MQYRKDVDGLRALAILPVVFYHAGTGAHGGFVGVDVFFVISGFLITGLVLEEMRSGRFSLAAFYERRVRRIVPALLAVLTFTAIVAAGVLVPSHFMEFGQSLNATLMFGANIFFWQEQDYFSALADVQPLLHMWSLAVEEQFYLVFPLLLVLVAKIASKRLLPVLLALALASFVASWWAVEHTPAAAFYLSHLRAWELLVGALLAAGLIPRIGSAFVADLATALGVLLIATAVFSYTAETPFPGPAALMPILGAALVLHGGTGRVTLVGRVLSLRPVVFVGLVSYSLYLWHWPLLAFAGYLWSPLSAAQIAATLFASFVAAVLSWKFVEAPFRGARSPWSFRRLSFASVAVALAGFGIGLLALQSDGMPARYGRDSLAALDGLDDKSAYRGRCHADIDDPVSYEQTCTFGSPADAEYAMWGDSHAAELAPMIGEIAGDSDAGLRQVSHSACPPVVSELVSSAECRKHNTDVLRAMLQDPHLKTVFLVARYPSYAKRVGDRFFSGFEDAARRLVAGGKSVVIIYPVPEHPYSVPVRLAQQLEWGADMEAISLVPNRFRSETRTIFERLDRIAGRHISRVYPARRLCTQRFCRIAHQGRPLYFDNDHLSTAGARYVAPAFEKIF